MSSVAAVVVRGAETLPVVRNPSSCCDAVITYASPTYRPSLKAGPTFRRRMRTPVFNPLLKVGPATLAKTPRPFPRFSTCFRNVSSTTDFAPRAPDRKRELSLSAKQMPLSDPRETEELAYPATSSVPPIGFQGKSDAQLHASPHCSELVISLGRVKRGMTMREALRVREYRQEENARRDLSERLTTKFTLHSINPTSILRLRVKHSDGFNRRIFRRRNIEKYS